MRGISETLGFVHMMREFKTNDWGRIVHRVDASACRAIMLRRGCGGLTHITVKSLWYQEAVRQYSIEIARISRNEVHAHKPCLSRECGRNEKAPDRVESLPHLERRGGRATKFGW